MIGTRLVATASVALLGVSFLLAQQPTSPSQPQGQALPGQQPNASPITPSAPTAPAAPVAQPGTAPVQPQTNPAQPQSQTVPGQRPNQVQPTPTQPNAGQTAPGQQTQPRTQDNSQRSSDQSQQPSAEEAKFVVKAGEINLAEVNLGRLAAQRASRQDVRQFANKLVQDHSANLQQLNQLANRHNMKGAERMDQEHQQLFQKLAAMQGQQFDQDFLKNMVEGHKKAAEVFKHASENCKNAELKQYATQTLAAIQQHEQEAQRLNGQNQGQTTQQSTSSQGNDANRTDGTRTDQNRTDQNRTDQNRTDGNRNDQKRTTPNREEKTPPDRRDDR